MAVPLFRRRVNTSHVNAPRAVAAAAPALRRGFKLGGFPSGSGTVLEVADVDPILLTGVGRDVAMSVPAVAACRNLIAGAAMQMDMQRYRGMERVPPGTLLSQPDPDCAVSETVAQTVDDLLFEGRAYWLVLAYDGQGTEFNPQGMPVRARAIPAVWVQEELDEDLSAYSRVKGYVISESRVDPSRIIRFKAPHDGILRFGAQTILSAVKHELAAARFASVEIPAGVITGEGAELSQAEADEVVAAFQRARQSNTVAYLQGAKFERTQISPSDLQLLDSRGQYATECTRLFNVPVVQIGASPTGNTGSSLLYANVAQNTAAFVAQAVTPILSCIEDSLSLPSVTPRGQRVAFAVGQYLRSDPGAAIEYVTALVQGGILSVDEGRAVLGIAPEGAEQPDLTPGRV